jgi:hypothetical protein
MGKTSSSATECSPKESFCHHRNVVALPHYHGPSIRLEMVAILTAQVEEEMRIHYPTANL